MLDILQFRDKGTININDIKYYYKHNTNYLELLVEQIAKLFDIKHVHYIPITYGNNNIYLSEDLNNYGEFKTAEDIGIKYNNLDYIRDELLYIYPNDYERLMTQVIKMYYMDLMILNIDRNVGNWGFLKDKNNNINLYILDNELSFIGEHSILSSCDNPEKRSIIEVKNILDNFPVEYKELFLEMYNELDSIQLQLLIHDVENSIGKELPNKDYYIKSFNQFRDKVDKLIKEKNKEKVNK